MHFGHFLKFSIIKIEIALQKNTISCMNSKLNGDFQSRAKKKCLELWRMKNQASQSLPNFIHQYASQTFFQLFLYVSKSQ